MRQTPLRESCHIRLPIVLYEQFPEWTPDFQQLPRICLLPPTERPALYSLSPLMPLRFDGNAQVHPHVFHTDLQRCTGSISSEPFCLRLYHRYSRIKSPPQKAWIHTSVESQDSARESNPPTDSFFVNPLILPTTSNLPWFHLLKKAHILYHRTSNAVDGYFIVLQLCSIIR